MFVHMYIRTYIYANLRMHMSMFGKIQVAIQLVKLISFIYTPGLKPVRITDSGDQLTQIVLLVCV